MLGFGYFFKLFNLNVLFFKRRKIVLEMDRGFWVFREGIRVRVVLVILDGYGGIIWIMIVF